MPSRIFLLLGLGTPGLMQSITAAPAATQSTPSRITSNGNALVTTQHASPSPTAISSFQIRTDFHYSAYIEMGMEPAAASYALLNGWYGAVSSEGIPEINAEVDIFESIASRLPSGYIDYYDEVNRLSIAQDFITDAATEDQALMSSFISVWDSYQSLTPDSSESSYLHRLVESTTQTSKNQAPAIQHAGTSDAAMGIAAGMLIAIAGFL